MAADSSGQEGVEIGPGIFSRERNAWIALAAYILLLYGTLTLTYDLYIAVFNAVGQTWVRRALFGIFLGIAGALLVPVWLRLRQDTRKIVPLILIVGILVYVLLEIEVPANQIHFLQYGPLTLSALECLRFRVRDRQIYPLVIAIVLLVGVGDELLQGMLPDRRFDLHDVMLNTLAGILVLAGWGLVWEKDPRKQNSKF